jgi:choline dehydrogenase
MARAANARSSGSGCPGRSSMRARAAEEIGVPKIDDFNAGDNEGSAYFEVNQKAGFRWNAVRPSSARCAIAANLRIVTGRRSSASFSTAGAHRASATRTANVATADADGEVILAAGAIGTPQAAAALRHRLRRVLAARHRRPPRIARRRREPAGPPPDPDGVPGHGRRTLNELAGSLFGKAGMALEYALRRSGPMAMAPSQLGIFSRSERDVATPNSSIHVQPLSRPTSFGDPLDPFRRSRSRSATSARRAAAPATSGRSVRAAGDPHSTISERRARPRRRPRARHGRRAGSQAQRALARYAPEEMLPGPAVDSDEDLARAIGDIATTIFHPVGTCRMGTAGRCRWSIPSCASGLDGLRVVDASIMPTITSGNTASPVVMIAEKAADLIRRGG